MSENYNLLKLIGLSDQKIKETLKNDQITNNIKVALNEINKNQNIGSINGTLIYHLASNIKLQTLNHIPFLAQYIAQKKIDSVLKLDSALSFLLHNIGHTVDTVSFEKTCGIGITITPEEIEKEVEKVIENHREEILDQRYCYNSGTLMQELKKTLKWADGKMVKNEIDLQILDLLGPKIKDDFANCSKKLKRKDHDVTTNYVGKGGHNLRNKCLKMESSYDLPLSKMNFHKPGENYKTEGYIVTKNTEKLLQKHLSITGGKVRTRFPPEPNGILHIGHAKAININFGYARALQGSCYLRYDDTNPEKEEEKFVTGILDIVNWLGYKPSKITHSSDYFDFLYNCAVDLIKKDLAYVCHQKSDEIKGYNPTSSPWRNRSISESLKIFNDMKDGLIDEGGATLRMKLTLEEGKQDPVAYRVKFSIHHNTGNAWCIYPTYDFTHCLCDSIENITHSLCTKEFQSRRSSYYWLCNALDIYCPVQWEYGRLNVSYTVVSKRKISKLIEKKIVNDWDDPRLYTLSALRRRGFPAEAINNFCAQMGVTGAQTIVDPNVLEATVRDSLNATAARYMAVFKPLKVTIINDIQNHPVLLSICDIPGENDKMHSVTFDRILYIDSSDFCEEADTNFRRLTLTQAVGLKYIGIIIKVIKIIKNNEGSIINIIAKQEILSKSNKPKAFIQWVAQPSLANIHTYEKLFKHRNPDDATQISGGFLNDVNYNSKKYSFVYIDKYLKNILKPFEKYQFERIGFYSVDPSSNFKQVIFNRTVTLKESLSKEIK